MSTPTHAPAAPAQPPAAPPAPPAPDAHGTPQGQPRSEGYREDHGDGEFTHRDGTRQRFPEATPVDSMTPQQAAAYWRDQSRRQQARVDALGVTPDQLADLRRAAEELNALTAASQTDQQRAVADAEARVRAEVSAQYAARLVDASITAAVAGRVPGDVLAQQLAPVDRRWFLTDDGDVDADKVSTYAQQLAGAAAPPRVTPPSHGAGYRPDQAPSGAEQGREMARRRGFLADAQK